MGRVGAPFGVRGWINVVPHTATVEALLGFRDWRMTMRGEPAARGFRVLEGRVHGDGIVARVDGITSREQAMLLRGSTVEVPREALPEAGEDEVYLADLPGCAVTNRQGIALGVVRAVEEFGAHPVLRVVPPGGGEERLIPFVQAYVVEVDLAARTIEVDWQADF